MSGWQVARLEASIAAEHDACRLALQHIPAQHGGYKGYNAASDALRGTLVLPHQLGKLQDWCLGLQNALEESHTQVGVTSSHLTEL